MCNQRLTPKYTSPYPQRKKPRKRRDSVSPTPSAKSNAGTAYSQIKRPYQSGGVCISYSKGHAKAWEYVSPTQEATPQPVSPYPQLKRTPGSVRHTQLKRPRKSIGVGIPMCHTKTRESVLPTQKATLNRRSPYAVIESQTEVHKSVSPTQRATQKCGSPHPQAK